ncbi:DUF4282 domain-containing protein [Actinomyces respiraculi]|uniref:DUF4282 domain-containing protein n=1 Tax=Actinomyces respiraculi TaxID=2744574 RepID=UPI00141F2F09|nr:DUF4282 domain-containing protein [Actinomyces respiraculi]
MQNPPVPEPSSPYPAGGYDAYPSAPAAGAPPQSYAPAAPAAGAPAQPYAPAAYGQPTPPPYASAQSQGAGFFKALFDFSFSNFITLSFAKFVYIAFIALSVLFWLFIVISGFSQDVTVGFIALLFGWIPAFIYIILIRLSLEVSVALIRTAQNTSELVSQGK